MDKPFDKEISKMSYNQLLVMRYMLSNEGKVVSSREIARKTVIVEKKLGGVLSAMSRKLIDGTSLIEPMGRDATGTSRWKLNSRAITQVLAVAKVKLLISSFK